jgi:hypothetical protein
MRLELIAFLCAMLSASVDIGRASSVFARVVACALPRLRIFVQFLPMLPHRARVIQLKALRHRHSHNVRAPPKREEDFDVPPMALAAARDLPVGKRTAGIDGHVKAL